MRFEAEYHICQIIHICISLSIYLSTIYIYLVQIESEERPLKPAKARVRLREKEMKRKKKEKKERKERKTSQANKGPVKKRQKRKKQEKKDLSRPSTKARCVCEKMTAPPHAPSACSQTRCVRQVWASLRKGSKDLGEKNNSEKVSALYTISKSLNGVLFRMWTP